MRITLILGAAALALAGSTVRAGGPNGYGYGYGYGWDGGYSACEACNSVIGCCDHPYSKNDHLWDNYCQEKWCPKIHSSRLQPYWHAAPYSTCSGPACSGPTCGTGVGSHAGTVSFSSTGPSHPDSAGPVVVTTPKPIVAPATPPSVPHPMPSAPAAKEPDAIELKLLSRPRAPQLGVGGR